MAGRRALGRRRLGLVAAGAALLAVVGCGPRPEFPILPPAVATAVDGPFTLVVRAGTTSVAPGVQVDVRAALTYAGPDPSVTIWGSGTGPVIFVVEQLDGPFDPGGGATDDCVNRVLERGRPLEVGFSKSGGFDANDPLAADLRAWFTDPVLRFPRGTFRITAAAEFSVGECGPADAFHRLAPTITIVVGGGSGNPLETFVPAATPAIRQR